MKVGIIGAGAMGCLLGSYLAQQSNEVWLIDIWEEHIQQINKSGVTVKRPESSIRVKCLATTKAEDVGPCDLVILSTKYHQTRSAVQNAPSLMNDSTFLMTIQNGIGNVDIIAEYVDSRQIVFGLTTLGSVLSGPGSIEVTFVKGAVTHVYPLRDAPTEGLKKIIEDVNATGLVVYLSPDVKMRIWEKVCLNAGFSVVTAVVGLNAGDCVAQPSVRELIEGLIYEISAVASKEGVSIDPEEAFRYVMDLARKAPEHRTSFLMDLIQQRKTEIDSLNDAIVKKAGAYSLDVPYNKAIVSIVKTLENTYGYGQSEYKESHLTTFAVWPANMK